MDNPRDWGLIEHKDWSIEISDIIDSFVMKHDLTKGDLARAFGFGKDFSPSSMQGIRASSALDNLRACIAPTRLPYLAAKLKWPNHKYNQLESLFHDLAAVIYDANIDFQEIRSSVRETVDWGYIGASLYDDSQFELAAPYLEASWKNLSHENLFLRDQRLMHAAMRVGCQLVSLDTHNQIGARSETILSNLGAIGRASLGADKHSVISRIRYAECMITTGIAFRLLGRATTEQIRFSREAVALLNGTTDHLTTLMAAWRDQTTPLIRTAVCGSKLVAARKAREDGLCAIERSMLLAGGAKPREELQEPWLFSALTQVDAFAMATSPSNARRSLERIKDLDWVGPLVFSRRHTQLYAKLLMTELHVLAAEGNLDEVGRRAASYLSDPLTQKYGNRMERVQELLDFASRNDPEILHHAVLVQSHK